MRAIKFALLPEWKKLFATSNDHDKYNRSFNLTLLQFVYTYKELQNVTFTGLISKGTRHIVQFNSIQPGQGLIDV